MRLNAHSARHGPLFPAPVLYLALSLTLCLALCFLLSGPARAQDIVLDPGHSPGKPGALSCAGIYEYVYNDALAATVAEYLASKNIRAEITRPPDGELPLADRAKSSAGKKLFIALHHDSAQPQFITYTAGIPSSKKAQGYSIFISSKNPFFAESRACALMLAEALQAAGLQPSTHHAEKIKGENRPVLDKDLGVYLFDDLVVLKNAQCPALVLEAAVIIHPEDEARAKTKAYQLKIAEAIAQTAAFALRSF